jgi:two-component system cell cycle sensor histidine kinase/response regulator CckA
MCSKRRTAAKPLLVCEQHPGTIHLLLTDVVLPRMSGRGLVDRVAPLRPAMKVPFMSGYSGAAVVHRGVARRERPLHRKAVLPAVLG